MRNYSFHWFLLIPYSNTVLMVKLLRYRNLHFNKSEKVLSMQNNFIHRKGIPIAIVILKTLLCSPLDIFCKDFQVCGYVSHFFFLLNQMFRLFHTNNKNEINLDNFQHKQHCYSWRKKWVYFLLPVCDKRSWKQ